MISSASVIIPEIQNIVIVLFEVFSFQPDLKLLIHLKVPASSAASKTAGITVEKLIEARTKN